MCNSCKTISLGFTEEKVPIGTHMCLVFTDDKERKDSILKFLLSGIVGNERTACFSAEITEETIRMYFSENGISYDENKDKNGIFLSGVSEVYFKDGYFDPDRMLDTLTKYYNDSNNMGFSGSRVIGEMTADVQTTPGGERLLEYESRVSLLVKEKPITAICQYDATKFNGATIMEVLKVHPKMIVNGSVVNNPFYIEPEIYLASLK